MVIGTINVNKNAVNVIPNFKEPSISFSFFVIINPPSNITSPSNAIESIISATFDLDSSSSLASILAAEVATSVLFLIASSISSI